MIGNMVQYSLWPNCCNDCSFCLRTERIPFTKSTQLAWLDKIKRNLDYIDFKNKFSAGISLLGGELYFIRDKDIQQSFLELVDLVIEKVLKVSENPYCRYSSVTNGLYDPEFLYKVIDKIVNEVGIEKVDINFSYDLKYRFKIENDARLVLKNINDFHKRYDYNVGVQMILTQYVIDEWKAGRFEVNTFTKEKIPGNTLTFLYPHPIKTGLELSDFNFKRNDFLKFIRYLKSVNYQYYYNFRESTKNSCKFKYTGLLDNTKDIAKISESIQPSLSDGKEIITDCGHSVLYRCYSDSNHCMLCDLLTFDEYTID